jgi:protein-tyrosine-phosphatase
MAHALMRHLYGRVIYSDSVGVRPEPIDPFVVAVMDELGIDMSKHRSKSFDDLEDTSFDVIVSLSPEAQHKAVEMTRTMACDVEYWPTFDPSLAQGSREAVMDAYRTVRDTLMKRIKERFGQGPAPTS